MDHVSLQPAAGAQGELAGVLMIRAYHLARGERAPQGADPRLRARHQSRPPPRSPASRWCSSSPTASGEVDLADLERHLDEDVAAFMITQPNTLGLFESRIHRDHRAVPRQGRAGLHGRRQPQRHPRHHAAGRPRLRRLPLQPAQDLHDAARRRRARARAGGRSRRTWRRSCPCRWWRRKAERLRARLEPAAVHRQAPRVLGQLRHARARLRLHPHHGAGRAARGVRERRAQRQLHPATPRGRLRPRGPRPLHARVRALGAPAEEARRHRDGHRQAAPRPRLLRADDLLPADRRGGADDRAHRDRVARRRSTRSATP